MTPLAQLSSKINNYNNNNNNVSEMILQLLTQQKSMFPVFPRVSR